jgi:hypothetical protein
LKPCWEISTSGLVMEVDAQCNAGSNSPMGRLAGIELDQIIPAISCRHASTTNNQLCSAILRPRSHVRSSRFGNLQLSANPQFPLLCCGCSRSSRPGRTKADFIEKWMFTNLPDFLASHRDAPLSIEHEPHICPSHGIGA